MIERDYLIYIQYVLTSYEPLFLELVLEAKWKMLVEES